MQSVPAFAEHSSDSVICFCFNKTSQQLQEAHSRLGSLTKVQRECGAGTKCGGCRLLLESIFNERPEEILKLGRHGGDRNICVRQGQRLMKGFVIADHRLNTVVYSSNCAPPQFGEQDMTMPVAYMLLDSSGKPVLHRTAIIGTNETFSFDARKENIPKPFYGMFLFNIGRANYGAGRFNSVWTNGISACSTHEVNNSGRPSVVLPTLVDLEFSRGSNSIHLALQNPHAYPIRLKFQIFAEAGNEVLCRYLDMPVLTTKWLNVSKEIFEPILAEKPTLRLGLRIESAPVDVKFSPTIYFFIHNLNTDLWSANHL